MGVWDSISGGLDDLAGSTDEAVARSFDNTEGGGLYDGTAGWLDNAAGSTDEATARQFDDTEGGGWYDGLAGVGDYWAGPLDEGVGGLYSLVDGEPGNTAGPGQTAIGPNATENPTTVDDLLGDTLDSPGIRKLLLLAGGIGAALVVLNALAGGLGEGIAG